MGMHDDYLPEPALECPRCGTQLRGWQGKDGPCELLLFKQGERVAQGFWPSTYEGLNVAPLPDAFDIYTWCQAPGCDTWVDATGSSDDGVWVGTQIARFYEWGGANYV